MCDLITIFDIYNIWNAIMADDGKAAGDFKKSPAAEFMEQLFLCSAVAAIFLTQFTMSLFGRIISLFVFYLI